MPSSVRAPVMRITHGLCRPDEDVARAGRTVDEVPGAKVPFLLLDDEEALAGENEEILLLGLGVIQAARLPLLEDVEAEAELREEDLLQLRALAQRWTVCLEGAAPAEVGIPHPGRVGGVQDEPAVIGGNEAGRGFSEGRFGHAAIESAGGQLVRAGPTVAAVAAETPV